MTVQTKSLHYVAVRIVQQKLLKP